MRINRILSGMATLFFLNTVEAGTPVWTFTPLTPTTISIDSSSTATVQYLVTNQSHTSHTLVMTPINGVTQTTTSGNCSYSFTLGYLQSCTLTLQIDGSVLHSNIVGGPKVCQQGNPLQCFQPSQNDILNITVSGVTPPVTASYAYITSLGDGTVSQCTVDSAGELSNCTTALNGFNSLAGVTINNRFAYFSDIVSTDVTYCKVNSTSGALTDCNTSSGFYNPSNMAIYHGSTSDFAYVANYNNQDDPTGATVSQCTINPTTGALSSCNTTTGFNNPFGIAIDDEFAYITNQGDNTVTQCTINPATGLFVSCKAITASIVFTSLAGIAIKNGYAYIAQFSANEVSKCTVDNAGATLSNCSTTSGFTTPFGVTINNGFAYITNGGDSTVSKCAVGSTGELLGCADTPSGVGVFSEPTGIAFYTN